MKPTSPRAARRLAKKQNKSAALTFADLANRVAKARARGVNKTSEERAKKVLNAYLQTAQGYGMPVNDVVSEMARGQTAWRLGHAVRDEILKTPPDAVRKADCKQGCAFCCILTGGDGGLITAFEAEQLHAALEPLQNQPDGCEWHPSGCPALDPATQECRAYEARPMICRSFLSTDSQACEENAAGGETQGAGLLGSHVDYLAVHALCRQTLKGITQVHTYSMASIAAGAVMGTDSQTTLTQSRHGPSALEQDCKDVGSATGA